MKEQRYLSRQQASEYLSQHLKEKMLNNGITGLLETFGNQSTFTNCHLKKLESKSVIQKAVCLPLLNHQPHPTTK